jgi:large-conductance mechanosensitive channel
MLEIDYTHVTFAIINLVVLVVIIFLAIILFKKVSYYLNSTKRIEEKVDKILEKLEEKN